MKTITLDWETYKQELTNEREKVEKAHYNILPKAIKILSNVVYGGSYTTHEDIRSLLKEYSIQFGNKDLE